MDRDIFLRTQRLRSQVLFVERNLKICKKMLSGPRPVYRLILVLNTFKFSVGVQLFELRMMVCIPFWPWTSPHLKSNIGNEFFRPGLPSEVILSSKGFNHGELFETKMSLDPGLGPGNTFFENVQIFLKNKTWDLHLWVRKRISRSIHTKIKSITFDTNCGTPCRRPCRLQKHIYQFWG